MSETLFYVMVCLLGASAVLGGLWAAGVEPVRDLLRWLLNLVRAVLVFAFFLGAAGLVLYGVIRLVRYAWLG